jgi:glutamate decarboxylase
VKRPFSANRQDIAALRIVVRQGFTQDLANMLVSDLRRQLPRLERETSPMHDAAFGRAFHQ